MMLATSLNMLDSSTSLSLSDTCCSKQCVTNMAQIYYKAESTLEDQTCPCDNQHLHVPFSQDPDADLLFIIRAEDIHQVFSLGQNALADVIEDGGGLKHLIQIFLTGRAAGQFSDRHASQATY